jgi:AAA+ superfamily predicted ATPase
MPTVSISFARSTSPTFPIVRRRLDALAALGTLTVTTNTRGVESWFELTVRAVIPAYRRLMNLLNLVHRWKSTEISIDGDALDRDGMDAFLNRLQEIHACWQHQRSRGSAACRRECRVGCHQLLLIPSQRFLQGAQLREPAWYTVGYFDGTRVTLDKATLLSQLERTRNRPLACCPHFSRERVAQAISALPDAIAPDHPDFRLLYHRDDRRLAWVWPRDVPLPPRLMAQTLTPLGQDAHRAIILAPHQPPARQIPSTRYADVCGQQDAVDAVRELIEIPITHAHLFAALGATVQPTGVILAGPPGTGKTLLARAIAGECGVHCETVAGPEILSQWVGGSEHALRDIFTRAATFAPSLILFDELDSIAPARALVEAHHQQALVAQLLTLLDGIASRAGVYVIGTTNRPEAVDPAIRRPGRFDRVVWLRAPDLAGRIAILQHHLRPLQLDPQVIDRQALVHLLARRTRGATGAELAYLCQQAVRHCIREAVGLQQIPETITLTSTHFVQALTTLAQPPRRRAPLPVHPTR